MRNLTTATIESSFLDYVRDTSAVGAIGGPSKSVLVLIFLFYLLALSNTSCELIY